MGREIRTSLGAMLSARELLCDSVDAFCSFELTSLAAVLPVAASSDHDLRLGTALRDALGSYARMVARDGALVQGLHEGLQEADQLAASAWETGSSCAS